ncbi:MAG TPA: hypothetical protein PLI43_10655 [Albidovulum sp.]|uniref:hypothetical protein n=1 Tax=Albidovulum sp. TaxID=1872424 RepID=UPI002C757B00|nr:hypothetical protein [Albidovulum sp.]
MRRRVFYIPGYDPFHPRRYRELYRTEALSQAAISGYAITVSARQGGDAFGWRVVTEMDGIASEAEIEVLLWSDIVRASMRQGIFDTYRQLWRTVRSYVGSGAIFRLAGLRKGPTIAALYPIVMLLLQLVVALGAGVVAGWLVRMALPAGGLSALLALASGLAGAALVLWQFRRIDGRLYAYYLMHDYAFTAVEDGAYPLLLEDRLREFVVRVAEALRGPHDEVIVVGHSSGAHLAVSLLSDLLRAGQGPCDGGPVLALLTLGHVVPMVSFLPRAQRLRGDLAYLSASDALTWVDVTAPGDGCTYALCDPVKVTGVAPPDQRWPLILSAAFTQTLSPARWQRLRWRFFRLHFQYLCAFDRPGDYDYFRITAGPLTLADRYRDRAPSKTVITRAASGYRDLP